MARQKNGEGHLRLGLVQEEVNYITEKYGCQKVSMCLMPAETQLLVHNFSNEPWSHASHVVEADRLDQILSLQCSAYVVL